MPSHFGEFHMHASPVRVAALFLLAGCSSQPTAPEAPAACVAEPGQAYLGQPASDATLEAIRRATGAGQLRALKPGQAATMDFRQDRVTVVQDAAGRIERITCG